MRAFSGIPVLVIFIACSSSPVPKGTIQPDKMQKIVYDLVRVDEFINNFVYKDPTINVKVKRSTMYEQVFKVHKVTRKDFYSSFKYYQQHPLVQKQLFDSLHEQLTRKQEAGRMKPAAPVP